MPHGSLAQLAEAADSTPAQSEFKSREGHNAPNVGWLSGPDLQAVRCRRPRQAEPDYIAGQRQEPVWGRVATCKDLTGSL